MLSINIKEGNYIKWWRSARLGQWEHFSIEKTKEI